MCCERFGVDRFTLPTSGGEEDWSDLWTWCGLQVLQDVEASANTRVYFFMKILADGQWGW